MVVSQQGIASNLEKIDEHIQMDLQLGFEEWTYNQGLRIYKSGVKDLKLVCKLMINKENFENDKCWVLEIPSSIHDNAFLEFKKNLKTELKKKQKFVLDSNQKNIVSKIRSE